MRSCPSSSTSGILSHGSSSGEYALLIGNQRLSGQSSSPANCLFFAAFALALCRVLQSCRSMLAAGHLAEEDPSKPDVRTAVVRKVRGDDGRVTMQVCVSCQTTWHACVILSAIRCASSVVLSCFGPGHWVDSKPPGGRVCPHHHHHHHHRRHHHHHHQHKPPTCHHTEAASVTALSSSNFVRWL